MNRTKIIIPILAAAAIGWSGAAYAGTDPATKNDTATKEPLPPTKAGNLDVQLTITNDCIVNNADSTKVGNAMLDFGSRMSLTKLIETNTSTNVSAIQITCTRGTAFNIALGKGLYHDGTSRRMGGGTGSFIHYDLYRSAGDTVPWGTTKGTDTLAVTTVKDDEPQPLTIYGRVPASTEAKPAPGVYKDTVAISVVF
jgi:spore coat protein U-like protein